VSLSAVSLTAVRSLSLLGCSLLGRSLLGRSLLGRSLLGRSLQFSRSHCSVAHRWVSHRWVAHRWVAHRWVAHCCLVTFIARSLTAPLLSALLCGSLYMFLFPRRSHYAIVSLCAQAPRERAASPLYMGGVSSAYRRLPQPEGADRSVNVDATRQAMVGQSTGAWPVVLATFQ